MSLFESVVLSDIMEIVPSDNNSSLHLHFNDGSSKDATSDRYIACEGALFINIFALSSFTRSLES